MDNPILVPGVAAQPTPRIQGATAQTAAQLETNIQRLIDGAAALVPTAIIASFDVGQSGDGLYWAELGFINPADYAGDSQQGQLAWMEFDDPQAPVTVDIASQGTPVPIAAGLLVAGSVGFTQANPGELTFGGVFGLGQAFEVHYMVSVRDSAAAVENAQVALAIDGVQIPETGRTGTVVETEFVVISGQAFISMLPGETLTITLTNFDSTNDLEVVSVSVLIKSAGGVGVFPSPIASVPAGVARVAIVEAGNPDGQGQQPNLNLISRIVAQSPIADFNSFVVRIQPVGRASGPAYHLAALYQRFPVPEPPEE